MESVAEVCVLSDHPRLPTSSTTLISPGSPIVNPYFPKASPRAKVGPCCSSLMRAASRCRQPSRRLSSTGFGETLPAAANAHIWPGFSPEKLKVVPVSLDEQTPEWRLYTAGTAEASTFFSRLALGHYDGVGEPASTDQIFKEMFQLLKEGADRLARRIDREMFSVGRGGHFSFVFSKTGTLLTPLTSS